MIKKLMHVMLRRKKLLFLIAALTVLGSGIFYGVQTLNKPAEGVVHQDNGQSSLLAPTILKDFRSQYFTSKYPSRYGLQVNQNTTASLESWILLAHQIMGQGPGSEIGISIVKLSVGGVKEDGAYKQFEAFPNLYTLTRETHQSEEVITAERTDPNYEHTVLWAHGSYLATFSMTSGQKNDQLVTEINMILDNLVWSK